LYNNETTSRIDTKLFYLSSNYRERVHKSPLTMHLILTGATGLVGSAVLDAMIRMQDVTRISILSRRPVPMATDAKDPRINVIIHKDFDTCPPTVLDQLKGATGVVWALGISQTQVGKE
jgi:hypothetical protein